MTGIVLADDHAIFAESLVPVLANAGFTVLAVAGNLSSAIDAVRTHRPEVCLLDRRFPDGDGLASIGDIIAICPGVRIVMLTADEDTDAMMRAVRTGVAGYVHKTWGVKALLEAIRRVADGDIVIDVPRMTHRRADRSDARRLAAHLTARERQCLTLIVEGLDTRAMARRLGVSATTVRTHVQALMTKLGVHSRLEAVSFAVRHELIDHHPGAEPLIGRDQDKAG